MDEDLIDYLAEKQAQTRLNDARFCLLIGLADLSTWLRYKRRERPPTLRLVQLAARAWPTEHARIWRAALKSPARGQIPA